LWPASRTGRKRQAERRGGAASVQGAQNRPGAGPRAGEEPTNAQVARGGGGPAQVAAATKRATTCWPLKERTPSPRAGGQRHAQMQKTSKKTVPTLTERERHRKKTSEMRTRPLRDRPSSARTRSSATVRDPQSRRTRGGRRARAIQISATRSASRRKRYRSCWRRSRTVGRSPWSVASSLGPDRDSRPSRDPAAGPSCCKRTGIRRCARTAMYARREHVCPTMPALWDGLKGSRQQRAGRWRSQLYEQYSYAKGRGAGADRFLKDSTPGCGSRVQPPGPDGPRTRRRGGAARKLMTVIQTQRAAGGAGGCSRRSGVEEVKEETEGGRIGRKVEGGVLSPSPRRGEGWG